MDQLVNSKTKLTTEIRRNNSINLRKNISIYAKSNENNNFRPRRLFRRQSTLASTISSRSTKTTKSVDNRPDVAFPYIIVTLNSLNPLNSKSKIVEKIFNTDCSILSFSNLLTEYLSKIKEEYPRDHQISEDDFDEIFGKAGNGLINSGRARVRSRSPRLARVNASSQNRVASPVPETHQKRKNTLRKNLSIIKMAEEPIVENPEIIKISSHFVLVNFKTKTLHPVTFPKKYKSDHNFNLFCDKRHLLPPKGNYHLLELAFRRPVGGPRDEPDVDIFEHYGLISKLDAQAEDDGNRDGNTEIIEKEKTKLTEKRRRNNKNGRDGKSGFLVKQKSIMVEFKKYQIIARPWFEANMDHVKKMRVIAGVFNDGETKFSVLL